MSLGICEYRLPFPSIHHSNPDQLLCYCRWHWDFEVASWSTIPSLKTGLLKFGLVIYPVLSNEPYYYYYLTKRISSYHDSPLCLLHPKRNKSHLHSTLYMLFRSSQQSWACRDTNIIKFHKTTSKGSCKKSASTLLTWETVFEIVVLFFTFFAASIFLPNGEKIKINRNPDIPTCRSGKPGTANKCDRIWW